MRIDLKKREANVLISTMPNWTNAAKPLPQNSPTPTMADGSTMYRISQTPWQEIQRGMVDQFEEGMVLKPATKYRDVAKIVPRDNH